MPASSIAYATPLGLELAPSRRLAVFLALAHAGAVLLLPMTTLPVWADLVLAVPVAWSAWVTLRRYALLRASASVLGLRQGREGVWHLRLRDGREVEARLARGAFVHPALVVLSFRVPHAWRSWGVPILPDMVDADTHRRLRVRLRMDL